MVCEATSVCHGSEEMVPLPSGREGDPGDLVQGQGGPVNLVQGGSEGQEEPGHLFQGQGPVHAPGGPVQGGGAMEDPRKVSGKGGLRVHPRTTLGPLDLAGESSPLDPDARTRRQGLATRKGDPKDDRGRPRPRPRRPQPRRIRRPRTDRHRHLPRLRPRSPRRARPKRVLGRSPGGR